MQVGFGYGIMYDKIEKQANEQGFSLGKDTERFEKCKEAITRLMFEEILTDSQVDKAFQKLNKKVIKALIPLNKEG